MESILNIVVFTENFVFMKAASLRVLRIFYQWQKHPVPFCTKEKRDVWPFYWKCRSHQSTVVLPQD
jgi:hypothetical protein